MSETGGFHNANTLSQKSPTERLFMDRPRPPPARRRDKPQLSCNTCRRRKVRCDRLHPCSNCSSRGLSSSCAYTIYPAGPRGADHVQDRVNHLESLVLGLMQQTSSNPRVPPTPTTRSTGDSSATELHLVDKLLEVAPSPSDYGSIRTRDSGVSYVSSSHWTAVLDSIAELRDHLEQDVQEVRRAASALHYVLGDPDEIGHHGLTMTSQYPPGDECRISQSRFLLRQ